MSTARHVALIYFTLDLVGGVERARALLRNLSEFSQLVSLSSVYKRYLTPDRLDLSARLEWVARLETLHSVDQVLHMILSLGVEEQNGLGKKGYAELTLLAFDDIVQMSPRLTLPHPQMHQDPLIIRCSAEAWGQYEHPIYQKNLSEMAKNAPRAKLAEFYMQGKSLVDF